MAPSISPWPRKPLESLLTFLTSGSRGWSRYYSESGSLFLRIQNVGRNKMLLDDVAYVDAPDTAEANRTRVQCGDVLLSITADLGRTAVVPERAEGAFINQHLALLRVRCIDPKYLAAYLDSPEGQAQIMGRNKHGVKAGLNFDDIRSFTIPTPSLEEQRRIAEVLDRAEALRAKRRAALALLDTLTQSIFLDLFGDPTSNPKGWERTQLGNVATFTGGGTPSRDRPEFFKGNTCWATSKDMKGDALHDTEEHITEEAIASSATKLVPPNTILVVVKSKILARRLPVAITTVPTCFGQDLKGINVAPRVHVNFVAASLRWDARWLLERARGINTEGLTLDHLRAFPMVLPPLPLQEEFARRAEVVERLKATQRTSLAKLDELFGSIQHRAFRGEL